MKFYSKIIIALALMMPFQAVAAPKRAVKQTGPSVEELIAEGRQAFMNYDFKLAGSLFAEARKKAKKNVPEELESAENDLMKAENFMERVEKIVILDSIALPKADFFKAYKLPVSSGYLSGPDALPVETDDVDYVFTNEDSDYKLWAQPDTAGNYVLMESSRLTDGSWATPASLPDILDEDADALYPFMMPDGVTLYFASDNEQSLGGLDIFVATRDATDGSFLQPQNMGMPYNSPYDDYLLAIDELNGVGWWATDRNQLGDSITVYLFKTNDIRSNYNVEETENLPEKARAYNYRETWGENDYTPLLEEISEIIPGPVTRQIDFVFPMSKGRVYYTLDDFKSDSGRRMMKKYLAAESAFNTGQEKLSDLRRQFAETHSATLKSRIRTLEKEIEQERETLRKLRSEVYRAEK